MDRAQEITFDSPIELLGLPQRVCNALREGACDTVRSLLEHDYSKASRRLGSIARREITLSLIENGFGLPATLADTNEAKIARMLTELERLRKHIDVTSQRMRGRVKRLEDRLRNVLANAD